MKINTKLIKHPYKTFIFLSAILIILGICIGIIVCNEHEKQEKLYIDTEMKNFSSKVNSILATYEVFSKYIFEETISKPQVIELIKRANDSNAYEQIKIREELYNTLDENYENIVKYDFRQLHFHLANGDSFLRFHSPEKFGDNLVPVRESIRKVIEQKGFIKGFEEGKVLNGYRFVYPIFDNKSYVGSVEISISMATLIEIISRLYSEFDVFFIMDGKVVEKTVFKDKLNNYEKSSVFENYYYDKEVESLSLKASNNFDSDKFNLFFKNPEINKNLNSKKDFSVIQRYNNKYYLVQFLSIKNISNNHVAYMISVSKNNSYKSMLVKYFSVFFLIISIVSVSIITIFVHIRDKNNLKILSHTDYLTQIYNRVRFMEMASYEMERAERYGFNFSIILFDIDFFKKVNDYFGHNIGDEVLVELAHLMSNSLRKSDILARWGGEEFICLLPNTTLENALIVAETLRKKVEDHKFYGAGHITISLGVCQMKRADVFIGEIIERADKALYKSKNTGRNRVSY